jgi:hypothetical protein
MEKQRVTDVTQEWSGLAFVEHYDPLRSVCLYQTEREAVQNVGRDGISPTVRFKNR